MFSRINLVARHLSTPITTALRRPSITAATASLTSQPAIMSTITPHSKRTINTAACLIIGDEVLGGKTVDTNSHFFAKYCFSLGLTLSRIETIADSESEIIEAVTRMSRTYDLVVTSGGIGPTHDDITYASIAKAFNLPLILHQETLRKMKALSRPRKGDEGFDWEVDSPQRKARYRMVELPYDVNVADEEQVKFVAEDLWVPMCIVNGNVAILPGIPRLYERMLNGYKSSLLPRLTDPEGKGVHRILFSTPLPESGVAGFLTELSERVEGKGVKVGSYPRWGKSRNTVTLVGRDVEFMESLVDEVEKGVQGRKIKVEGEDDDEGSDKDA